MEFLCTYPRNGCHHEVIVRGQKTAAAACKVVDKLKQGDGPAAAKARNTIPDWTWAEKERTCEVIGE